MRLTLVGTSRCEVRPSIRSAIRIKYYDDPFFKEMLARQEGKPLPRVQGVGPWNGVVGGDGGDEVRRRAGESSRMRAFVHSAAKRAR